MVGRKMLMSDHFLTCSYVFSLMVIKVGGLGLHMNFVWLSGCNHDGTADWYRFWILCLLIRKSNKQKESLIGTVEAMAPVM